MFAMLLLSLCILWGSFGLVAAQGVAAPPDYVQWRIISERAERMIEAGRGSKGILEHRRDTLAKWRTQFSSAQDNNKSRINTLKLQITTLGSFAEDGNEPAEIQQRRAELTEKINILAVPVLTAQEAYNHADGLIREIDTIIRMQQTDQLFALGASALDPNIYIKLDAMSEALGHLRAEFYTAVSSDIALRSRLENFLVTGFYLAMALLLLLRGGPWVETAGRFFSRQGEAQNEVWRFLISIGRLVLPVAALFALSIGLSDPELFGSRSAAILEHLPLLAIGFVSLRWASNQLLIADDGRAFLAFSEPVRATLHRYALLLTVIMLGQNFVFALLSFNVLSEVERTAWSFPFILLLGVALFWVGQTFKTAVVADGRAEMLLREQAVRLLGRAVILVSVLAPVLAAIGYQYAAEFVLFNTLETLALLSVMLVFLKFLIALYQLAMRDQATLENSLIPLLLGFLLSALAVPVLGLIWGARVAELTELWAGFNAGIMLGDARLSPMDFVAFTFIFGVGYTITRLAQGALRSSVLPKTRIDIGARNAITSGVGYVGIFLAGVTAISSAGLNLSSLAIVAGALSVGIGFGLQNIVSNFVSGIILLIERPITEGDWIEVAGHMGYVRDISVRSTRIETFDRTDVIVPNADLVSGVVTNWTRGNTVGRLIVPVGVAYGTDSRKVEKVLREIAEQHLMVLTTPAPYVVFQGFGADSMDFEVRAILRDVNCSLSARSDINHAIAKRFSEEGIEIPFPQRDVWLRNPQSLKPEVGL
jgi:potassium efflux system protein